MTKVEAKKALTEGHKIRHGYFPAGEYVYMDGWAFKDERGNVMDLFTFWDDRQRDIFQNGWTICD
jgi:hypothetical protein